MYGPSIPNRVSPPNLREVVHFDILGRNALYFTDKAVWHYTDDLTVPPLPSAIVSARWTKDKPFLYDEIRWIGAVKKRRPGLLILGVFGAAAGLFMIVRNFENSSNLVVAGTLLGLFGLVPLGIYFWGRSFLVVSTGREAFSIPMDRQKPQVRRTLALLKEYCPPLA